MGDGRLERVSISERERYAHDAKTVIKNNFIFGAGIKNYGLALHEIDGELASYQYEPVHNVFLLVWAETGLLGLVFFLIFLFLCFLSAWRSRSLAIPPLLAMMIALMLFDHWLWSLAFGGYLFWLIMGMSLKNLEK